MSIPLLNITPVTQNQRVEGYEVGNEDTPIIYRLSAATTDTDINELIWYLYRQIFSEHLILDSYRQPNLESQLRNRAITVREFVRVLGKSDVYRRLVGETNSNYRLVDLTFKRLLGRATYNKDEQIAQSIIIATQGLHGFIDSIVDSEEYTQNFGDDIVPYQRRRFKERPFNLVNPRYSDYWRTRQINLEGSYYQVRLAGQGNPDKRVARRSVPDTFFQMARGLTPTGVNYQQMADRASNYVRNNPLLDTTREIENQPLVGRNNVALPYRYLPTTPKS
uniref:Phycobilisome rod-core linker polypeptide n=1 Tax=Desertifilum tharense IPPAS B-1220 TaxID=1781255 RepID=A0ACD5H237_9CYAN